ncbi:integrase [Bradyrhizobium sp. ERR14]|nr:integrase [Bradyrhizobium sp. ERR14]
MIRLSLKTDDLAKARAQRDILEEADNILWASMLTEGGKTEAAMAAYKVARARAEALGFAYRPALDIAQLPLEDLYRRFSAVADKRTPTAVATAIMGGVDRPKVLVSEAFKIYCDEIAAVEIVGKSEEQKKAWRKVKQYAVDAFTKVVGEDLAMDDITRDHAKKMHDHFKALIAPTDKKADKKSASLGKRRLGDMSILYKRYYAHIGVEGRPNPFEGLTFNQKFKKRRLPFPIEWVRDVILKPGALAGLNEEARHIVLVSIETGARPIELRYLREDRIKLNDKVPHILVEPSFDPDEPHEVKTVSSVRRIPLVGVALEVMKRHKDGFPRYRDSGNTLSATVNSFLKENNLQPTGKETLYSFRHTFEDRLKEGRIDDELRKILMGHTIDREQYGSGGSLKLYHEELMKIVYPFDPSIV